MIWLLPEEDDIDEENLIFKEVIQEDGTDKFVTIENDEEAKSFINLMLMKIREEE